MSDTTTQGIRVEVECSYLEERSSPRDDYYFFSYQIRISNLGTQPARLISRRWVITDSDGRVETVEGPGVVGHQPVLPPGGAFEYTSFCPLPTFVGTMHGVYRMTRENGEEFEAEIAPFTLAVPGSVN